jgi:hypothetical protein
MFFSVHQRFGAAARYFAFNGFLALCALSAVKEIMRVSVTLAPDLHVTVDDPSRVEAFKQFEAAAAQAPNVPVPRVVVAHAVPDIPVQVLAVRMDQAESLKATPIKLKRKPAVRTAKLSTRKKSPAIAGGALPPLVVDLASNEAGVVPTKRQKKKGAVVAESSRDITNRSLGVLVALKY